MEVKMRARNDEPSKACAFIVLTVELGSEKTMLDELKAMPEVKDVHMVHGAYDIIVRVESDTMFNIKHAISWKIRRLYNVRSMLTMIVTNVFVER
jgi:DNA-binding Lrp family transcriptional regulator